MSIQADSPQHVNMLYILAKMFIFITIDCRVQTYRTFYALLYMSFEFFYSYTELFGTLYANRRYL